MLNALTLLLVCQLAGELLVAALGIPVPGPVAGMAALFILLVVRGGIPDDLAIAGDGLLRHLSLLFVPAGVGISAHLALLERDWFPLSVALIASTLLAILASAGVMIAIQKYFPTETLPEESNSGKAGDE